MQLGSAVVAGASLSRRGAPASLACVNWRAGGTVLQALIPLDIGGTQIRQARELLGWPASYLAFRAKISTAAIDRAENGRRNGDGADACRAAMEVIQKSFLLSLEGQPRFNGLIRDCGVTLACAAGCCEVRERLSEGFYLPSLWEFDCDFLKRCPTP